MKFMRRYLALGLLAGTALAASSFTASAADLSKPAGKEWPAPNGDWTGSRFSTLTQINPGNVKQMGGAWLRKFNGAASRGSKPPSGIR